VTEESDEWIEKRSGDVESMERLAKWLTEPFLNRL
jgi:hypothetical protein